MKKITGKLSLQWRLTLITALLMTVTCILMYFFYQSVCSCRNGESGRLHDTDR